MTRPGPVNEESEEEREREQEEKRETRDKLRHCTFVLFSIIEFIASESTRLFIVPFTAEVVLRGRAVLSTTDALSCNSPGYISV